MRGRDLGKNNREQRRNENNGAGEAQYLLQGVPVQVNSMGKGC